MQEPHLKLKEIIWEVTGKCNNGCTYCGSKSITNTEVDETHIRDIATAISKYPPEQIDISGGDPLLVSVETHEYIINTLKDVGVICKVLLNPKSLFRYKTDEEKNNRDKILNIYDWYGVSINTIEELNLFNKYLEENTGTPNKFTIISNFNLDNIFIFNEIRELVQRLDTTWQVQYTIYNEYNPLALYNNDRALQTLFNLVQKAIDSKVKLVLADNINNGACSAGKYSIGILNDGIVVPCLSIRSWGNIDIYKCNILNASLETIWKNNFNEYRFQSFKCCKDKCLNKVFSPSTSVGILEEYNTTNTLTIDDYEKWYTHDITPGVAVYAVIYPTLTTPNPQPNGGGDGTFVYGVPFNSNSN